MKTRRTCPTLLPSPKAHKNGKCQRFPTHITCKLHSIQIKLLIFSMTYKWAHGKEWDILIILRVHEQSSLSNFIKLKSNHKLRSQQESKDHSYCSTPLIFYFQLFLSSSLKELRNPVEIEIVLLSVGTNTSTRKWQC